MTNIAADYAVSHLEQMLDLGQKLAKLGVTVYQHEYNYLVFGSWFIIAGKSVNQRYRFAWDGKEQFLIIACAGRNQNNPDDWEHYAYTDIDKAKRTDTVSYIEKFFRQDNNA